MKRVFSEVIVTDEHLPEVSSLVTTKSTAKRTESVSELSSLTAHPVFDALMQFIPVSVLVRVILAFDGLCQSLQLAHRHGTALRPSARMHRCDSELLVVAYLCGGIRSDITHSRWFSLATAKPLVRGEFLDPKPHSRVSAVASNGEDLGAQMPREFLEEASHFGDMFSAMLTPAEMCAMHCANGSHAVSEWANGRQQWHRNEFAVCFSMRRRRGSKALAMDSTLPTELQASANWSLPRIPPRMKFSYAFHSRNWGLSLFGAKSSSKCHFEQLTCSCRSQATGGRCVALWQPVTGPLPVKCPVPNHCEWQGSEGMAHAFVSGSGKKGKHCYLWREARDEVADDGSANDWIACAPMRDYRLDAAMRFDLRGERVIVVGGVGMKKRRTAQSAEWYSPHKDAWFGALPTFNSTHACPLLSVSANAVVTCIGDKPRSHCLANWGTVEMLDLRQASHKWTTVATVAGLLGLDPAKDDSFAKTHRCDLVVV